MRSLFDRSEAYASLYYDAKPLRRAAVLFSRQTAEHHTGDDIGMTYERHFSGMLQALTHDHQSFVCLYDWHLCPEELADVDVLVLPNTVCLSDAQLTTIRDFVLAGGGLVATADTSLADEFGRLRADFGLADLFGVHFVRHAPDGDYGELQYREGEGYREIPEAYLRIGAADHPVTQGLDAERLVPVSDAWWVGSNERPVPDYVIVEPDSDTSVLAELYLPAGGEFGTPFRFPLGHPPGIVARQAGAGRVVYFASGISQHYFRRGLPTLRTLLNDAVDWAAGTPRPVRMDAPLTVFSHLTNFAGPSDLLLTGADRALALHLINYTGNMHEVPAYRVEYVAPIGPIATTFAIPSGCDVVGVTTLGGGSDLPWTRDGDTLAVTIDQFGTHQVVLVHLADGTPQ